MFPFRSQIRLKSLCCAGVFVGLTGCASVPETLSPHITKAPTGNFQLVEASADIDANIGRLVRWGGEVMSAARDAAGNVQVVILERQLSEDGRPRANGPSDGRFVIQATPSVDPDLYEVGTYLTVAGSLIGSTEVATAGTPRPLPLVKVTDVHNWGYAWSSDPYYDHWPYATHHPYYGPRFRFGIGIHRGLHRRHPYWYGHGYPYW